MDKFIATIINPSIVDTDYVADQIIPVIINPLLINKPYGLDQLVKLFITKWGTTFGEFLNVKICGLI